MVSSVGSAPYSYLDQLTGKPAAATQPKTVDAATASAANAFGLSDEVVKLLQSVGGSTSTSNLLGVDTDTNFNPGLLGSKSTSSSSLLTSLYSGLLDTNASSGIYQSAINGAANKKSAVHQDFLTKVLDAYHNAINNTGPASKVNITG